MKTRRECAKGHVHFKSSKCLTCPRCEAEKNRELEFIAQLAAPARRALSSAGLTSLAKLSRRTERQVSELHGMGPNAIAKLRVSMRKAGLSFARASA
jgi:predicted RecB family nuclease